MKASWALFPRKGVHLTVLFLESTAQSLDKKQWKEKLLKVSFFFKVGSNVSLFICEYLAK